MGLFSKKTVKCSCCGKEFQTRIGILDICDECSERINHEAEIRRKKVENVRGYVQYAKALGLPQYSDEQLDEIAAHKERIWAQFRCENGISKEELKKAADNYSSLSDQQAMEILQRVRDTTVEITMGAGYTGCFFVPFGFDGTIVDSQDIFAVAMTNDFRYEMDNHETLLCVVFTNDPYIPAFPIIYLGKLGFFEVLHSKKGRQGVELLFRLLCPNLTYPVQDIKQLKKQLKQDGRVRGTIPMDMMLSVLSHVSAGDTIFKRKYLNNIIPEATAELLTEHGYIPEEEIQQIMRLNKMFPKNYWEKIAKKLDE